MDRTGLEPGRNAPRISINVLTGKNGLLVNFVTLWRRMKRCVSSA